MIPTTSTPIDIEITRGELAQTTAPVLSCANTITITDQDTYQLADNYLKFVRDAKSAVEEKLSPIIRPVYEGLQALYTLRRELTDPLDQAETRLRTSMSQFLTQERKRLAELERVRQTEIERVAREAEQTRLAARHISKSDPIARAKAALQAKRTIQAAVAIVPPPPPPPTRASHSSGVPVENWQVSDTRAFLQGVIDGTIPEEMIAIHTVNINAMWRMNKNKVKGWPGVKIVESTQIRGR